MKTTNPYLIIPIGVPLSGKSTKLNKDYSDAEIICRDSIILELHGSNDYNVAFKDVNQKEVDRILRDRMVDAAKNMKNVVIDMTHMSAKRRKFNISFFPNHTKICVVFPFITQNEWEIRNAKRFKEENKHISWGIVENMMKSFQKPDKSEGFNKIIYL